MRVSLNKVVQFHYSLTDETGAELESTLGSAPNEYLHGHKNILPALERAIADKNPGDTFSITLEPASAYGVLRENSEQRIPIKHLQGARRWRPGMTATVNTQQGQRKVTVLKVGKFMATIDTNHPWAGKQVNFDIEITDVRDATREESAHGHVHGKEGHPH